MSEFELVTCAIRAAVISLTIGAPPFARKVQADAASMCLWLKFHHGVPDTSAQNMFLSILQSFIALSLLVFKLEIASTSCFLFFLRKI